jgi:hypothetical protein
MKSPLSREQTKSASQGVEMQEEIGITAGVIWGALDTKGEVSVARLKKAVNGKTPIFEWAVGWLMCEDKLIITPDKRSFRLRLKGAEAKTKAAGAS